MRIISQDGEADYPYEKSLVYVDGGEIIVVFNDEENVIATYDTEEKAKKVMESLRMDYTKFHVRESEKVYFAFDFPKMFQFPKNSEVK